MTAQKRRYDEFLGSMKSLFDTGKYSDFIITCGDDVYNVHKSIVCSQSDFFDAASKFGKEGEEGKVDLPDDLPILVKYMIQYFYELDYRLPSDESERPVFIRINWDKYHPEESWMTGPSKHKLDRFLSMLSPSGEAEQKVLGIIKSSTSAVPGPDNIILLEPNKATHIHAIMNISKLCSKFRASATRTSDDVWIHAQVYSIADKYNVAGLKSMAHEKFAAAVDATYTGNVLLNAAHVVFETTPDTDLPLRLIVAKRIARDLEIYGMLDILDHFLRHIPHLSYMVLHSRHKGDVEPKLTWTATFNESPSRKP